MLLLYLAEDNAEPSPPIVKNSGFSFANFRGRGQLLSIDYSRGINQQQQGYNPTSQSSNNNKTSSNYIDV